MGHAQSIHYYTIKNEPVWGHWFQPTVNLLSAWNAGNDTKNVFNITVMYNR